MQVPEFAVVENGGVKRPAKVISVTVKVEFLDCHCTPNETGTVAADQIVFHASSEDDATKHAGLMTKADQ